MMHVPTSDLQALLRRAMELADEASSAVADGREAQAHTAIHEARSALEDACSLLLWRKTFGMR